ncbi:EF-hand domain-containing protein [Pseudomarimonas salicorniae]|uniref:EF-hand domain-containing protein n=1 Tax=Pseudomarimonas salicorniae TaxID=2933270 RepID=A0ABT0GGH4_9GAMM|nr:EF-hand domain-containing protein [Lysobacter sp. CAU 1642]MCK7593447.1 EF-hand domain-containing protein [Lysobacter sp. CAU 1642]
MDTRFLVAAAAALSLVTGAAFAHPDRGAIAKRLDSNRDQRISREEAALVPRLAQQFPLIDRSGDGLIDRDEFKAYAEQRRALREEALDRRFALLDADRDGVLSGAEIEARPRLARLDGNDDGRIERAEFTLARWFQARRCGR